MTTEPTCQCKICAARLARDEPPLAGISISTAAHVVEQPRRNGSSRSSAPAHITRETIRAEIQKYADDVLVPGIAQAVGAMVRECEQRLAAKIAALEDGMSRSQFAFRGLWREGELYKRGDFVSIPACGIYRTDCDTQTRPGGGGSWVLVLKAGRDGKDYAAPEPPALRTVRTRR